MTQHNSPEALEEHIRAQLDALDAHTALYAKHLATGREIAVRADDPVEPLSIIKIPILILAYRDVEQGALDLDERYLIGPDDLRRGTGLLKTFAVGLKPTWRDLLTQMIITSDNTATDIVLARLGLERVNALLEELGYQETRMQSTIGAFFRRRWEMVDPANVSLTDRQVFERGFPMDSGVAARNLARGADPAEWLGCSTASEMARLLEQIHHAELTTRQHSDEMADILRQQLYSSRLPQRLALRVPIAHKTGDSPPMAGNDAGIIYAESSPLVVSLFVTQNRGDFFEVEATHGRIAELLVDAWG